MHWKATKVYRAPLRSLGPPRGETPDVFVLSNQSEPQFHTFLNGGEALAHVSKASLYDLKSLLKCARPFFPPGGRFLISRTPRAFPSRHDQHRRPCRRVKAPLTSAGAFHSSFAASLSSSSGSPPLTRRRGSALPPVCREGDARPVERYEQSKTQSMDNQPSFAQRTAQLKDIAFQLKNAADVVLAEVQHMEAAQERFAQKAKAKPKARAYAPPRLI